MECECNSSCPCDGSVYGILTKLLCTTYTLLVKTQNVHWHIEGPDFGYVHALTEDHYNNLFAAVDEVAERIRMIGFDAPCTMEEFAQNSAISGALDRSSARSMIAGLLEGHKTIIAGLSGAIKMVAEDAATADLLTKRLAFHEKAAWILASLNKTA